MSDKDKYFFNGKNIEDILYEDEQCLAFEEERQPQSPIHFLVVPKKVLPRVANMTQDNEKFLGHLLEVARSLAIERGLHKTGYHVKVDEDFKTLNLKSVHVFGRALHHMIWPIGPWSRL